MDSVGVKIFRALMIGGGSFFGNDARRSYRSIAASLATSVGVLHAGKFEQVGAFDDMYEQPKTKWVGQFLGEFPMNFLPAEAVGKDSGAEIGFYPEWVTVGSKGTGFTVDSLEKVGDTYYLFCSVEGGEKVIVKSPKRYDVGDSASFVVDRFNVYKDTALDSSGKA